MLPTDGLPNFYPSFPATRPSLYNNVVWNGSTSTQPRPLNHLDRGATEAIPKIYFASTKAVRRLYSPAATTQKAQTRIYEGSAEALPMLLPKRCRRSAETIPKLDRGWTDSLPKLYLSPTDALPILDRGSTCT